MAPALRRELATPVPGNLPDATPGVSVEKRLGQARAELLEACDGFLARESLAAGLTREAVETTGSALESYSPRFSNFFQTTGGVVQAIDTWNTPVLNGRP